MRKILIFLISFVFILGCKPHRYLYRVTYKVNNDFYKIGLTDVIDVYGDSIGWYNDNGSHIFFPKNSIIDTILIDTLK